MMIRCRLNEEIDEEYEKESAQKAEEIELENSFIFSTDFD